MNRRGLGQSKTLPVLRSISFRVLGGFVGFALFVSLGACLYLESLRAAIDDVPVGPGLLLHQEPHLRPRLPHLPAFPVIDDADRLIRETLHEDRPSIAGIAAILYRFLDALHSSNRQLAQTHATPEQVRVAYAQLAHRHLVPLDRAYRGRSVFSIRNDDSIFVSLAAYREHLLADTLQSLFGSAVHPQKIFVGVIVNNCFQTDGTCQGGVKVVGQDPMGRDILRQINGIPDTNHIETFCHNATFRQYCRAGQIRALYVHETEALGPAVARYYSSKLWGGETYYVQIDSHLHFANQWDQLYIQDLRLCKSFPKAILSTYPPGFVNFRQEPPFTPGTRLCRCQLRQIESGLPRVEMEGRCHQDEKRPSQMPFMAAGFFFVRADFLRDVPFDPFLPWMFMGEEIALSIRAWTHGWNIYAPRKNLIGHQYRPIKMGNPHYQDSVGRLFDRPAMVGITSTQIAKRIKFLMGYPHLKNIPADVLLEVQHYGAGIDRSREDYLQFAEIDLEQGTCGPMKWCIEGALE